MGKERTALFKVNGFKSQLEAIELEKAKQSDLLKILDYFNGVEAFNGGYSWWVYPNIVKNNNKTYMSYVKSTKETEIAMYDHILKTRKKFTLQVDEVADEHNSAAICVMPDGKILSAYTKHNTESKIYIRRTVNAEDISVFETPIELATGGNTTYAQLIYMNDKYFLFYRVNSTTWAIRASNDGIIWSSEKIFLTAPAQYYMRAVPYNNNVIRILTIGHPKYSTDHNIRYVAFYPGSNEFKVFNSVVVGNRTDGTGLPLVASSLPVIFAPTSNARLFDTSCYPDTISDITIAHASFSDSNDCVYQVTKGNSADGFITSTVCNAGKPLETPAGDNYYFGGMWFEYKNDKVIYVARESNGTWYIEKYITTDYLTWTLSKVIATDTKKLHRPCIPFGGGNLVWETGDYTNFTNYDSKVVSDDWYFHL